MRKLELLIPAGSLDVLKTAVLYGADAVYLGGEAFGLRAKAKNFTNIPLRASLVISPTYPFTYSSRFPYIIIPSKTSYIVMLFLPYFDSFCKYKFIFHRRFLYYHRFSPFFFVNFANF